jgi:hydrogenase assembly chaperone HypC/HupF|tara:strand:- start:933 stop:1145 length:213 start_codon:yes stop_codon:yes gene_type:complete
MCLAFPGKILEINNDEAIVAYGPHKRKARLIDKSFKVGDYVIVNSKIVIQKIPEDDALKSIELWKNAINP